MSEAKLPTDSSGEKPIAAPRTIFRHRAARSKANIKKRPASLTELDQSDSFSSSDDEVDTLSNTRAKRRKYGTLLAASTIDQAQRQDHDSTTIRANRDVPPLSDTNDATKQRSWYDKPPKTGPIPMSNVRVTTITDFKPDVCKDYQRSGWCGYGDTCVFLHDRSDTKQGWQLDKEWEVITKGRQTLAGTIVASAGGRDKVNQGDKMEDDDDDDTMLQSIPFACIICEKPYRQPVITQCRHYFCEPCALKRYQKEPTCSACGAATKGVFNSASRLEKLSRRKKDENGHV